MKVVINRCFGGFGLSQQAVLALAHRKYKDVYCYKTIDHSDRMVCISEDEFLEKGPGRYAICTDEYLGNSFIETTTMDSSHWLSDHLDSDIKTRSDPDLVAVVEELGKEADGVYAELKVVDVGDISIDSIELDDYDGIESIHERHRVWN